MSTEQTPPVEAAPEGSGELPVLTEFPERKKRKKRREHKVPGQDVTELNLTAMMDMMTILLVFLVKSYSTDEAVIQVNDNLRPPESSVEQPMSAATTVTVTAREILVEDKSVMTLDEARQAKGTGVAIRPLQDALQERAEHLKALEDRGGAPFEGKLRVVAHQETDYDLLTAVIYSAGQAEFSQYLLVVMAKPDEDDKG